METDIGSHWDECWREHHECAIAEVERLRLEWTGMKSETQTCQRLLLQAQQRIAELEALCTEQQSRQDDLWAQVKEKAQQIDQLESMIVVGTAQKQRIADLEAERTVMLDQLARQQERIAELEAYAKRDPMDDLNQTLQDGV